MKNILIVEDDLSTYKLLEKILELYGFKAMIATNGKEGLELFIGNDFDLIISDISMPVMDGYELLEHIRESNRGQAIPFIFLTSSGDPDFMRRAMNLGADDFIIKPFQPEDLLNAINTRFKRNKVMSELFKKEVKDEIESLKKQLFYNIGTEVANKNLLNVWLTKTLRVKTGLILLDIILDGYKDFITFLSHKARTFLLNEVIYRLKETTGSSLKLYQLSDEHFVLAGTLEDDYDITSIEKIAISIIKSIERPIQMNEFEIIISAIIAIVVRTNSDDKEVHAEDILQQAEITRQYISRSKNERYQFYSLPLKNNLNKIMKEEVKRHIQIKPKSLEKATTRALSANNFENMETKVFFLYPPSIIKDNLINDIIAHEYAAFLLYDHEKAKKLLASYNNSILLINLEKEIPGLEWEDYIREMQNDPVTARARIGVLSYSDSSSEEQKYLMKLMIDCGYMKLKVNMKESREIVLKSLEAMEARGQRKYVRVKCQHMSKTSFNIKLNNIMYHGTINDISSVGMACEFDIDSALLLKKDTVIEQLNLNLEGTFCSLEGIVMDKRSYENKVLYLIMFKQKLNAEVKARLHKFISTTLQAQIEQEQASM